MTKPLVLSSIPKTCQHRLPNPKEINFTPMQNIQTILLVTVLFLLIPAERTYAKNISLAELEKIATSSLPNTPVQFTMKGNLKLVYKRIPQLIPFTLSLNQRDGIINADITANGSFHLPGMDIEAASFAAQAVISSHNGKTSINVKKAVFTAKKLVVMSGGNRFSASPAALSLAASTIQITKPQGKLLVTHKIVAQPIRQNFTVTMKTGSALEVPLVISTLVLDGVLKKGNYSVTALINGAFSVPDKSLVVESITTKLTFPTVSPLTTAPNQTVKVKKLLAGVLLEEGAITFRLTPKELIIAPTRWKFQTGMLGTEAVRLKLKDLRNTAFAVTTEKLPLNYLVGLLIKKDIEATGMLSGRIPIKLVDGVPLIVNGKLTSAGGGIIRYTAKDSGLPEGNKNIDLLRTALQNFHYSSLTMTLNSKSPELVEADLTIIGFNPEVYSGKTFELHIHLQGNLTAILKSNIDAYNIPKTLQKQFMDGSQ
jgi:hypothetical protein